MRRMLDPKTIALIGATEVEGTVGRTIMENLMRSEGRDAASGQPEPRLGPGHRLRLPNIAAVPGPVDLAVVATPAATVPDVLLECAKAGVSGAIVVSAGFGETGKEGLALEKRIKKKLRDYPMRVLGPNSLGVIRPSVGLNASLLTAHACARRHRAHLAERRARHGDAGLGGERPRGLLVLRLGGGHDRRRLRRPHRLPRRGPLHAQHPHLHGERSGTPGAS